MARRVLILGAGVCGLAAAWRLLENQPDLHVTLLEIEERPGGLARSLTVGGQVADMGPHRIFTELPDVQQFLDDLAGDQLETVRRSSRMWLRRGWIEYPPKPLEIARHLGITALAGAGTSYLLEKATALMERESTRHESFESLMRGAFGSELYHMLVAPYAEKVWKVAPSEIHADIARVRVSAGGLDQMIKRLFIPEKEGQLTAVKKFYYLAGGVESLVRKLADGVTTRGGRIDVVRNVTDVQPSAANGWKVSVERGDTGAREHHEADHVISTIPLGHLVDMLQAHSPDEEVARRRAELRFLSNFLVCLVVKRPQVTDAQWLYFPEKDTVFNRAYEPKNFHASMGTRDRSMIVFEITAHPGDALSARTDRELLHATIRGAERVGLLKRSEIAETLVHRIPFTYPLYDLDYRDRLAVIWRYLERFPTLVSCGRQGLFLHNNMDHSMHMGFRAAACLTDSPQNPATPMYREVRRFQQFRIVD
jgi:protoporphyrinogen oxidase